ncbi:hypothetical protein F7P69_00775 [Cellulosimicrobium funkei]|nr:hypothetical protein [Cellulosimicrobium funkei]
MITTADVIDWSGMEVEVTDFHMVEVVAATNTYVEGLPSIDREEDGSWSANTRLGALMLASRLYRRKDSPAGVMSLGDTSTFVSRWDDDLARLLNLQAWRKPMVG